MQVARIFVALLCFFIFCCAVSVSSKQSATANIYAGIGIEEVERTIDLSKPNIVRQAITITAVNAGDKTAENIVFALPQQTANKLAFFEILGTDISNSKFQNKMNKDATFFDYQLRSPLEPKGKITLKLSLVLVGSVVPYPEFIKQKDQQKLLFRDTLYFFSPYSVKKQRTVVLLENSPLESYSDDVRPVEYRSGNIVYGPYSDQKPFVSQELRVHFQNHFPFVVVTSLTRILEISHWGALSVEEHYEVRHAGAKLKGSFSRLDYSRNPYGSSPSSFRSVVARLPLHASEIYYRDRIGNISTSTVRESADKSSLELELNPRFPMFGGWKTTFYIGYTVPIGEYLFVEGGRNIFKAPFSSSFEGAPIEELTVKVIIPEGAANIEQRVPFAVDSLATENLKTYLDVTGRTVLVFQKKNVVKEHNQIFQVSYDFTTAGLLQEPLLVIGALFTFCILVMSFSRLDFSIGNPESVRLEEASNRAAELVEQYTEKQNAKTAIYQQVENNFNTYITGGAWATAKKSLETINNEIEVIKSSVATDVASKIANIESKDKEKLKILEEIIQVRKEAADKRPEAVAKIIEQKDTKYHEWNTQINDALEELNLSVE